MKVSLNWVKEFLSFELPAVDVLEQKIGAQLGAIEETENVGEKYKGIVVARVVSCVDHPNSDHLHVCMIDDGGVVRDVPRDENGHVQVVCGAPNVREGLAVAWLPPGSTVPETYGKEPFVLGARELRGVMSNGMLASARELAIGDSHEGIVELDSEAAKPGDDFAKTYKLDDYIIDIENKMFTHRPDLFGELGVAREIAGILGQQFTSPEWYKTPKLDVLAKGEEQLPLEVRNELPELVPRFMAVALNIDHLGSSPLWLQTYLSRVGLRPINKVVDITNYMMILTGQPLHAYDYDKVKALSNGDTATLVVRYPHAGEKLRLLNGKEIEPRDQAIMIATDKQAIGVGGVMGGGETEVDENTKRIILEIATFDMYSIRRTSMAHGLFTDAVTRFNKGQSPLQNPYIMGESLRLLGELAGATLASDIRDDNHVEGRAWIHPPVPVTTGYINTRLGLQLSAEDMKRLLENVEFSVTTDGDNLTVTAPFWRTDIELREDVVEEVGRLYGFDHLPLELPSRIIEPTKKDELLDLKSRIRAQLSRAGANEVLTYSFVHGNLLEKVGQDKSHAFQISNAISPDLQYYRLSITPSLLEKIHSNIKAGYDEFALFEIGRSHYKGAMDASEPQIPNEDTHVALVLAYSDKSRPEGAAYYLARKYLGQLINLDEYELSPLANFDLATDEWGRQFTAPYEPGRSAVILKDGQIWGVVGEFKPSVKKALKLPAATAGFEVHAGIIGSSQKEYQPLPRFPKVDQDVCLRVSADMPYQKVYEFVESRVDDLKPEQTRFSLSPVDIYQREDDKEHKQITLRLSIASYEKTMTDEEIAKILDEVATSAKEILNAERV